MLGREIRAARPADALLSEEEQDNAARCGQSRVWIVDPLDGTREYGEGRDDWAVHVALAVDGVAPVGAVALPGLGLTPTSGAPAPLQPATRPLTIIVSRPRPTADPVSVATRPAHQPIAKSTCRVKVDQ